MGNKAYSLKEALDFFLENHLDSLECIKEGGETLIVDCYTDAKAFFNSQS